MQLSKRSYSKYWQNWLPEWNLGFSVIKGKTHRENDGFSSQTPALTRYYWGRLKLKIVTRIQFEYFRTFIHSWTFSEYDMLLCPRCYYIGSHMVVLMFENTAGLEICPFFTPLQSWGINWYINKCSSAFAQTCVSWEGLFFYN